MKLAGILLIIGFALAAAGTVVMFLAGDIELNGDDALVVPEGADSYAYLEVDMGGGGPIEGSFESTDGSSVRFCVMDEGQFESYLDGLGDDSRTATLGAAGEFSIEQVDMTVCYIVVRHSYGTDTEQTVNVEYTVTTTDWTSFAVWLGLYVVGGGVIWTAFYMRNKARAGVRTFVKKYTDVVFFDE